MQYAKLGNTGLEVSRFCLGCMSFGDPTKWIHEWVLDETSARGIVKRAIELGINFFDTANVYSAGTSEEILGRLLKEYGSRDELVIATKVAGRMHTGPNGAGLSRKAILSEIDKSLRRLGTDYIDVFFIHRWDNDTPIEETMDALNTVVKSGKARYLGASSMSTWQFQKAQYVAERNGFQKFVVMQNHLNLLYREEEREMLPFCQSEGIAITPYSPLASGRLARTGDEKTQRSESDNIAKGKYDQTAELDRGILEQVAAIAAERSVTRSQVALAWLLKKQPVVSPIVGATKLRHLEEAIPSLEIDLTVEEIDRLEKYYHPHGVTFVK